MAQINCRGGSKREGVAGYIEGVDRLRTREWGTACYSEDMGGDGKGLGRGSYTGPEAYGTRGLEVFVARGAWAGFLGDFVGVVPVRAGLCCGLWGPWGL